MIHRYLVISGIKYVVTYIGLVGRTNTAVRATVTVISVLSTRTRLGAILAVIWRSHSGAQSGLVLNIENGPGKFRTYLAGWLTMEMSML